MDEWIRNMADIGSYMHHASIIGQAIARGLRHQVPDALIVVNSAIYKEIVNKLLKVSELQMSCGVAVRNMVLSAKEVNTLFLLAKGSPKEHLGLPWFAGTVAEAGHCTNLVHVQRRHTK